jgi:mannose-6-phosphate isomerase
MSIERLKPVIQKYPWGHTSYLQQLVGADSESIGEHWAELWMGTHPAGMSQVINSNGGSIGLDEFVRGHTPVSVGRHRWDVSDQGLPFLFKVLAVSSPLSIQCHPTREQARRGYEAEQAQGLDSDAAERSYRDANHKPEIICAVTDFTALCGFKRIETIIQLFTRYFPEVYDLLFGSFFYQKDLSEELSYRYVLEQILTLSAEKKTICMQMIHDSMASLRHIEEPEIQLVEKLLSFYPDDPSVLSPLYLELYKLKPGEALYVSAGVLHTYIEGIGVELMAASDNVIRGGLTHKHVDAAQLMGLVKFSYRHRHPSQPIREASGRYAYHTPAQDFELYRMESGTCTVDSRRFLELAIQLEGESRFTYQQSSDKTPRTFRLERGQSCVLPADIHSYTMECEGTAFMAGIPEQMPLL